MMHITAGRLREVVCTIFEAGGVPQATAAQVTHSLVENNLTGHDSHGVLRITYYVRDLLNGKINPNAQIKVIRETPTTALLDGDAIFGILGVRHAMNVAMEKARAHNVGFVAICNTHHTGRMGEYVVQAAEAGLMGLVFGRSPGKGSVAPFGGTSRALNTNPIAWGIPAGEHPPVFMDFATSACAQGKIALAVDQGKSIPEGWLLDVNGNPTTDPNDYFTGGIMLPFGGHKGYGMGTLVELVAGGLTSTSFGLDPDFVPDYATVAMAVNIGAFCPLPQFRVMVDAFVVTIKAGRKAEGVDEIFVPGEPEWRTREIRLRDGLDLPDATWQRIVDAGALCGVEVS
ncbi:MAG: Ldh family oxidoreductase [Anaerolineae bacterium]|nr:Ldh family oxidoreductase [Anaerolineae bacterium]